MSIIGSIDLLSPSSATGWIYNTLSPEPVIVQAVLNGQVIGETVADGERPDLVDAGVGDGRCGFSLTFGFQVEDALLPFVCVRPYGGSVELPRTSLTGYIDGYRALRARFPGASWSRSMLGGLWTDRLDARRRLSGKVAAGIVNQALEPSLAEFIERGFVACDFSSIKLPVNVLSAANNLPNGRVAVGTGGDALLRILPEVIFQDAICRLTRAIFEDNPIACATIVVHGEGSFLQPTGIEALPSPAECVAIVFTLSKGEAWLDVVSGSQTMPEFLADGSSRWTPGARLPSNLTEEMGFSLEILPLAFGKAYLVAPGMLARLRTPADETALMVLLSPARQTPLRFLKEQMISIPHPSGAMLVA